MFTIGEYVVHGSTGVCKVVAAGTLSMGDVDRKKKYYTLEPVYEPGSVIYTPIDNPRIRIRAALSEKEAKSLIRGIQKIEPLWVQNEKQREVIYKEAIMSGDCTEWIKIIKALYLRKQSRMADGKKVTAMDERYYRLAEKELYGELAVSLSIPKENVEQYIEHEML